MPDHFDPTESQRYRAPVSASNHDLLRNMNARLELLEDQFTDLKTLLADKFDALTRTMRASVIILVQAPVSVTGLLIVGALFWLERLSETTWLSCCAVLLYPLYGEGIIALINRFKGK